MARIKETASELPAELSQFALPDFQYSFHFGGTHWRRVHEGWSYPEHNHLLFELNIVREGEQITTLEGDGEYGQRKGDIFFIQPGCLHSSRIGAASSMTYFSLHFDIDDPAMYRQLSCLGTTLYENGSELARLLAPFFDRLLAMTGDTFEEGSGSDYRLRATVLGLILQLCDYAAENNGKQDEQPPELESWGATHQLREKHLLEKRIQDVLEAPLEGSRLQDPTLYPRFRWVGLFSLLIPERSFWTKTERFFVKLFLDELLSELGVPVVVIGKPLATLVLFSDRFHVPPLEEYAVRSKAQLEKKLSVAIQLGFGGISHTVEDIGGLYRQSLLQLDLAKPTPGMKPSYDLVSPVIRSALLMLEADYANPDLSLAQLARTLGLTPNYVSGLFTADTGHPFTWHLSRIRMDRAKELLRDTNGKVFQIARQVGYADQAYFSRSFKAAIGISPLEFRKHVQTS
ncbi:AraC family transcriptional regulator [Gorillibacterium sp. CAU 1737]|uniref:AraC family transcriptional regulator n=1 Tax=Gorillibacterium sp. CAU 1737 TaxID=3140362 RepID=UPI0032613A11